MYATPAPVTSSLFAALEQAVTSGKRSSIARPLSSSALPASPVCEREILPDETQLSKASVPASTSVRTLQSDQNTLHQNGNSREPSERSTSLSQAEAASGSLQQGSDPEVVNFLGGHAYGAKEGSDPTCRVCLGILQSLDGPLEAVSPDLLPHLSERDGGGAPWSPVKRGDAASIADHIK